MHGEISCHVGPLQWGLAKIALKHPLVHCPAERVPVEHLVACKPPASHQQHNEYHGRSSPDEQPGRPTLDSAGQKREPCYAHNYRAADFGKDSNCRPDADICPLSPLLGTFHGPYYLPPGAGGCKDQQVVVVDCPADEKELRGQRDQGSAEDRDQGSFRKNLPANCQRHSNREDSHQHRHATRQVHGQGLPVKGKPLGRRVGTDVDIGATLPRPDEARVGREGAGRIVEVGGHCRQGGDNVIQRRLVSLTQLTYSLHG